MVTKPHESRVMLKPQKDKNLDLNDVNKATCPCMLSVGQSHRRKHKSLKDKHKTNP